MPKQSIQNLRTGATAIIGLALLMLGAAGAKWSPGGVHMALLTILSVELIGMAVLLVASRDLDKKEVTPFWASVQTVMAERIHQALTPELDRLMEQAEMVPPKITIAGRLRAKQLASELAVNMRPEISDEQRAIYRILSEVMDRTVIEASEIKEGLQ